MQLPFVRSRYNSLPLATDSSVACTGFLVLSASAGNSHVFLEKSSCAPAPDGGVMDRFSFRFVVVGLFVFCAADDERAAEAAITTAMPASTMNAGASRILGMVFSFSFLFLMPVALPPAFSELTWPPDPLLVSTAHESCP